KIRLWLPKTEPAADLKADPTILSIESETEEIFESRVYHLQDTPEAILLALRLALAERGPSQPVISPEDIADRAAELMADATFKFLAKRRTTDGLITDLLLFQSGGWRHLMARQDWVVEEDYRNLVSSFEIDFMQDGLVSEPLVVTVDEWRRYTERSLPPPS
ncbi:MAG: hypothetical protein M1305_04285, partial [Candidatus Marsarchaeota archaeon]|nr:hypothetical protein [Candidatus Marsarchaeota archaeon]